MGTQGLIEQLRKGTAGLTLYGIEALWGEAATALSAVVERRKTTGDRFFIDHGQIHDRATGKHVTTDEDSVFCDGINSALELLNTLNAAATEAADAITTLRAALEVIKSDATHVIDFYHRNGPTWTGKDGHEYDDMSSVIGRAETVIEQIDAALKERVQP